MLSFKDATDKIQTGNILSYSISGNTLTFTDQKHNVYKVVVQYDPNTNQIYPPQVPTVTCLKGHIHEYGADLSNASVNMLYIGRNLNMGGWRLPKSKWSNAYTVKDHGRDNAFRLYKEYILSRQDLLDSLPELTGKVLACWCHPNPCHGHILIELYNERVIM